MIYEFIQKSVNRWKDKNTILHSNLLISKRLLLRKCTFWLLILTNVASCQINVKEVLKNPDFNCERTQNLSFNKISKKFPFNVSSKVVILSFNNPGAIILLENNETVNKKGDSLPRIGNKLAYNAIKEIQYLSFPKVVELSDLLFNFNFDPKKPKASKVGKCYNPRNAIVFLNDKTEIVEYIEICFTCLNIEIFKNTFFGEFCKGKFELLKEFFENNQIEWGVTKFPKY